jgi:hypothetical protein
MEDAMGDVASSERLFVSLQAPMPAGTAIEAHRAAGMLLSPELVLVPRLPLDLVEEAHEFHVLIVGAPSLEGRAVERLGISYLEAHGREGDDDNYALVIELARPSSFRVGTRATIRSGDLGEQLQARAGDVWRSLGDLGVAGPGSPDDVEKALGDLPGATIGGRAPDARVVPHDGFDLVAWSLCAWVPFCHPRRPDRLGP